MQLTAINKVFNKDFFYGFKPLFSLINHSFWRGFFGPFFAFFFPLIFISILGTLLGYDQILGGALIIGPIAISVIVLPNAIFEFKESSLLKRIGSTPIKPLFFMLTIGFFYLILMIISLIWSLIFSLMMFSQYWDIGRVIVEAVVGTKPEVLAPSFSEVLNIVNWGGVIFGQIMSMIVGVSIGIVLASFATSSMMIMGMGTIILISTQFLTGQVLPPSMIVEVDVMWYGGYFLSPFKAPTSIILESWNGSATVINDFQIEFLTSNPFDLNQPWIYFDATAFPKELEILSSWEKWLNIFLPFIWFIGFMLISMKKFKWSTRG